MPPKDINGSKYVSLKMVVIILVGLVLSGIGGWASQRYAVESHMLDRLAVLEKNQARVMERLESNGMMLDRIYLDLKELRNTGK